MTELGNLQIQFVKETEASIEEIYFKVFCCDSKKDSRKNCIRNASAFVQSLETLSCNTNNVNFQEIHLFLFLRY